MDKLKIAFLCNGYGRVSRGSERFTSEFYNHMKNLANIDIYGMDDTDHSIGLHTKFRDEIRLPWRNGRAYLESYYFSKKWYKEMLEKKDKKNYDIIFNNAGIGGSYWCKKYRKKTNTSFITRARGGGYEEKYNIWCKPNCMIFLTKENRRQLAKKKRIKTVIIPNAIDLKDYSSKKEKSEISKGMERPIFLSTSAFVKFKRNDLIIKAMSHLDKGSLLFVGDGPLKKQTLELGDRILGKRFKYGGNIPYSQREEIMKLYQDADVFVQTSRKDAFPNVYLEAMASNLPIVTQNDGRRKEIINNAGILVDCSDVKSLSEAMYHASEKQWDKIPFQQAEKFSWDIMKKKYMKLFEEMV